MPLPFPSPSLMTQWKSTPTPSSSPANANANAENVFVCFCMQVITAVHPRMTAALSLNWYPWYSLTTTRWMTWWQHQCTHAIVLSPGLPSSSTPHGVTCFWDYSICIFTSTKQLFYKPELSLYNHNNPYDGCSDYHTIPIYGTVDSPKCNLMKLYCSNYYIYFASVIQR